MSRVIKPGIKYMNTTKYDSSVTGPSKMIRIHSEGEDYQKAKSGALPGHLLLVSLAAFFPLLVPRRS